MDRLAYFSRAVADAPDVARARFGYAVELQRVGRHADAVEQYRAYLDLQNDEGNAWGRLGESLTALGDRDGAADAYLTGIEQALAHGHQSMADELQAALEDL